MNLTRFRMFMNMYSVEDREESYRHHFDLHIHFINYSLTKFLKKIKFETDGTFKEINLRIGMRKPEVDIESNLCVPGLYVDLPFDFDLYDKSDTETRCKYYIELVRQGLEYASKVKKIPVAEMMEFLHDLAAHNFTYSWDFKTIVDREHNFKVKFIAELGTDDFILKARVFTLKPKALFCEGPVVRTFPDEICFRFLTREIQLENGKINFYDYSTKMFYLKVKELFAGKIIPHFTRENEHAIYAEGVLSYDNYEFKRKE